MTSSETDQTRSWLTRGGNGYEYESDLCLPAGATTRFSRERRLAAIAAQALRPVIAKSTHSLPSDATLYLSFSIKVGGWGHFAGVSTRIKDTEVKLEKFVEARVART